MEKNHYHFAVKVPGSMYIYIYYIYVYIYHPKNPQGPSNGGVNEPVVRRGVFGSSKWPLFRGQDS